MERWLCTAAGILAGYWVLIPLLERSLPEVYRPSWWRVRPWTENFWIGIIVATLIVAGGFVHARLYG